MRGITSIELEAGRRLLRSDGGLGLGNFLARAAEAFPPEARLIAPARPFETVWGELCATPTLTDWNRWVERYARRYAALGVGPRDLVGVYGELGARYFLHFLALSRLGAVAVLVNEAMAEQRAARYLHRVGVVGCCTDRRRREPLQAAAPAPGFVVTEDDLEGVEEAEVRPYSHHGSDPVLITHSSGTTGLPKAVVSLHGGFFYAMARSLERPRDPATRKAVCALPPSHNSAIGAAVIAVVNGEELIQTETQEGAEALAMIRGHRPTSVVGFPRTWVDLLCLEPDPADLASVMLWVNLGDAGHEAHIRRLMRYGNHLRGPFSVAGSRFVDGLGSSEMGSMLFSTVHAPGDPPFARCLGSPQPEVEAEVLDEHGEPVEDGTPGWLAVRSPGLSGGYWNDSNRTYRSRRNGYFLTGDLAYRDEAARFHHLDRTTDVVSTDRGLLYTLPYEEALMMEVDELLDCSVAAVPVPPGGAFIRCFAVPWPNRKVDPGALAARVREAAVERGFPAPDDVRVVARGELPVGVTGKVLKRELRRQIRHDLESGARAAAPAFPGALRERA